MLTHSSGRDSTETSSTRRCASRGERRDSPVARHSETRAHATARSETSQYRKALCKKESASTTLRNTSSPRRLDSAESPIVCGPTASTRPTPHKHSRTPPRDKAGTYDLREPLRSPTAQSPANLLYRHSTHAGKPLAGRPGTPHSRPPARQRKRGYREGSDRTDRMRGSPNAVLVSLLCW